MALQMKPACERCGDPLDVHAEAYVCSYECTFCQECTQRMNSVCPNCGGELVRRPRRGVVPVEVARTVG